MTVADAQWWQRSEDSAYASSSVMDVDGDRRPGKGHLFTSKCCMHVNGHIRDLAQIVTQTMRNREIMQSKEIADRRVHDLEIKPSS